MEQRGQIFGDPERWLTFCAWGRDPALDGWLLNHPNRIAEELAWRVFPKSTAGLESALAQVRAWLEDRKSNFGNQARTQKLLALMTLQLSHRGDQDRYFRIIKAALQDGAVIHYQAQHDDPWGTRSLWA
jgi:hypothetical protein